MQHYQLQPHQQIPQPTTERERASAISNMGGDAPRPPVVYVQPAPVMMVPQQPMMMAPGYSYPNAVPQQTMMYPQPTVGAGYAQRMMQQPMPTPPQPLVTHQQQEAIAAQQQQMAVAAQLHQQQASSIPLGWPQSSQPVAAGAGAPVPASADWSLDGVDLNMEAPPKQAASTRSNGNAAPQDEVNDWPCPEGTDPSVWAQLPAHMQRELLMQQGIDGTSAAAAYAAHAASSAPSAPTTAPSTLDGGSDDNVVVEVLARISARTLSTKAWKPSVAVVKHKRELLVFRSQSDWNAYRNANVHTSPSTDVVQALKAVQELVKLHVRFATNLRCTPIKIKSYKGFGNLNHFTLETANGNVVAKLACTTESPLFQLRSAITLGCRAAEGLPEQRDDLAHGRYNADGDVSP